MFEQQHDDRFWFDVFASDVGKVTGTITVFAAASLQGAFTTIGKQFEAAHPGTTVKFSFGPSSGLADQIKSGSPADVFASASTQNMTQVVSAATPRIRGRSRRTSWRSRSRRVTRPM